MPQPRDTDFTPQEIRDLREHRGQSQTEFGLDLYAGDEAQAQVRVSELERGERQPTLPIERTLDRMEEGAI
jgi:transcriptional regulator with XRE-family HTH domain